MFQKISDRIYSYDHYIKMGLGIHMQTKTILIEHNDNGFLISAGPLNDQVSRHLKTINNLVIFAPNLFHHIFLHKYKDFKAKYYGPLEVLRKNPKFQEHLGTQDEFASEYETIFTAIPIDGIPKLHEMVLYYKPEKTLIITDLSFNMNTFKNKGSEIVLKLVAGGNGLIQSRFVKLMTKDQKAYKNSINKILDLDIEKVIFHHGDNLSGDDFKKHLNSLI